MAIDTTQLDKIIQFVQKLKELPGSEQFIARLREVVNDGGAVASSSPVLSNIDKNVQEIRHILHIQATPSIDYSFIDDQYQRLRNQLVIDNLRMEQSALDLHEEDDVVRFCNFCIYAFYQIENLVNYHLHLRYPNFADLVEYLKGHSNFELATHTSIKDINISTKLWAFCAEFFPNPNPSQPFPMSTRGYNIQTVLREIRNRGLHRCQVLFSGDIDPADKTGDRIYKFCKNNRIDDVRDLLESVVDVVRRTR